MKKIYIITVSVITISIAFFAYNFFTNQKTEVSEAALSRNGLTLDLNFGNNDGTATPTVYDTSGFNRNAVAQNAQTCNNNFCDFNGSNDYMVGDATGVFNSANLSIAVKFTPDFEANDGLQHDFFDTSPGGGSGRSILTKLPSALSNALAIYLGNTTLLTGIPLTTYQPFWKVGQENVLIYSGTTGNNNVWLNGNKIMNGETTSWVVYNPYILKIGAGSPSSFLNGKFHYFKVWNRLLTDNEVANLSADRKTTAQTPSRTGLVGHWNMDANDINGTTVYDKSGNHFDGTSANTPTVVAGKIDQAVDFNNINYITTNSTVGDVLESAQYTVSEWFKLTLPASALDGIFSKSQTGNFPFGVRFQTSNSTELEYITTGAASVLDTNFAPEVGVWYLVTVVFDNTIGRKFYVNGSLFTEDAYTTLSTANNDVFMIGSDYNGTRIFNGSIDDVRIYDYALSAQEVSELYSSAKTNYTQTPSRTGLIGHWNMDSNDINGTTVLDKSGRNNNGTLLTTANLLTGKINQSLDFSNQNNTITVVNNGDLTIGTKDFTWSTWVKLSASSLSQNLITKGGTGANQIQMYNHAANLFYAYGDSGSFLVNSGVTPVIGRWYLVTLTRSGTTAQMYIDGVAKGAPDTSAGADFSSTSNLVLGDNSLFFAEMDDARVYNRALSAGEVANLYSSTRKMYIK